MVKPILITGAHRSGTTWVGKIISSSPGIQYVHEPFNVDYNHCEIKPFYWFQYITRENENLYFEYIEDAVAPKVIPADERNPKLGSLWLASAVPPPRVLMKDPIAVFSSAWLASRFNMDVVVLIRHPAAFVDSICNRNWPHDFSHFLRQPLLMKEHLSPFAEEIARFSEKKHDILDQAILLWKLIYFVVSRFRIEHADWLFVKHEDLSLEPEKGFQAMYRYLHVPFNEAAREIIEAHSNRNNPIDGDVHSIRRNSKAIVKNWKKNLSPQQLQKIRDCLEPISMEFYSNEDWE